MFLSTAAAVLRLSARLFFSCKRLSLSSFSWGTFAPEQLESNRRVRSLGLSAVVRAYNEAAAPGLGGLWFAKSLMLALLGLRVAAETRRPAILVTNAIEALACLCDYYAGHGVQIDDENYIVPVDTKITSEEGLKLNALSTFMSSRKTRVGEITSAFQVSKVLKRTGWSAWASGLLQ